MGEDIAQNRFAYSQLRQTQTQDQTATRLRLTLDLLPRTLFQRRLKTHSDLSPGARPSALDWIHALSKLEGSLSRCSKVKTHYYPSKAKGCVMV